MTRGCDKNNVDQPTALNVRVSSEPVGTGLAPTVAGTRLGELYVFGNVGGDVEPKLAAPAPAPAPAVSAEMT